VSFLDFFCSLIFYMKKLMFFLFPNLAFSTVIQVKWLISVFVLSFFGLVGIVFINV